VNDDGLILQNDNVTYPGVFYYC